MVKNKRYVNSGIKCIENQFFIDTKMEKYFFIDKGLDEIVDKLNEQDKQITILEKEKEFWKSDACNSMNLHNMLSFEIQKLSETKDIDSFLDFYYKYFCKSDNEK